MKVTLVVLATAMVVCVAKSAAVYGVHSSRSILDLPADDLADGYLWLIAAAIVAKRNSGPAAAMQTEKKHYYNHPRRQVGLLFLCSVLGC